MDELCGIDGCAARWDLLFRTKKKIIQVCEWHAYLVCLKDKDGNKVEVKTRQVVKGQEKMERQQGK